MKFRKRDELDSVMLPGRIISKVVGADGPIISKKMTVGFANYCEEAGPMSPHKHAEETVYIVSADRAWMRYGDSEQCSSGRVDMAPGMTFFFDEDEWHVFEYESGGSLEIIFIYGQANNIRPEERK